MTNHLSPIILFCYNRPDHTAKTIDALKNNHLASKSDLFVFCDGPKNESGIAKIEEVHKIIDNISGFKNVIVEKRDLNRGLKKSVIYGVSKVIEKFGKVIVVEDDIVTSPRFLEFMNESLDFYQNDKRIFTITGFNYPKYKKPKKYSEDIFFVKNKQCSWGWAIWKDRWQEVDFEVKDYPTIKSNAKLQKKFNAAGSNLFDILKLQMEGKVDTWDIQVSYTMFKKQVYCVFPVKTLVKNIGFDSSGIHCHAEKEIFDFDFEQPDKKINLEKFDKILNNNLAEQNYLKFCHYKFWQKNIFTSKKKRMRWKYILIGAILAEAIRFIVLMQQ